MNAASPIDVNPGESPSAALSAARRFGDGPVSGAAVMISGRVAGFAVTLYALSKVAHILTPADYGLVAMVTSATAFFTLFADFGLSLVTVQRSELSAQQKSTLFWINAGFGLFLGCLAAGSAPILVLFYGDARLLWVTFAIALVFPLTSLGTQHEALLKRDMKFRRLVVVRLASTILSAAAGVAAARAGWGYWSIVVQPLSLAVSATIMFWFAMPWIPGAPRRCEGLSGMLGFGGALTAHGMVGYLANNLDNILIGRYWGDIPLGMYSTSYGLMMRPISLAGYGVGEAAIPALSRAVLKADQLRPTFRRMFELTCLLGLPICIAGLLWADDLVVVLLGDQWLMAIPVLRWLFVAALPRMLGVCTGWVYIATGRPGRMLTWQIAWTPFIVLAFVLGLPYGAVGVAAAYAIANWMGLIPNYLYCFAGTSIILRDIGASVVRPLVCTLASVFIGTALPLLAAAGPMGSAGPVRLAARFIVAAAVYVLATGLFIPFIHDKVMLAIRGVQQPEKT